MPFGKYKGTLVSALPNDYLQWLVTRDDLRDPLRAAIMRECHARGQAPDPRPLAARLQDARARGFFAVPAGHEAEVGVYHDWCAATGTPSVCVSVGEQAALIAVVFFGPALPVAHIARFLQTLEGRWRDYAPQYVPPRSFILLSVPPPAVEEVAQALSVMARQASPLSAAPAGAEGREGEGSTPYAGTGLECPCLAHVAEENCAVTIAGR
jgi:hypothetical protein